MTSHPRHKLTKTLLSEACFEFEIGNYFIKTKSGTSFKCTLIQHIEDFEYGKWLRLENVWETNLWSENSKVLPIKPGATIDIPLDSIEVVARS